MSDKIPTAKEFKELIEKAKAGEFSLKSKRIVTAVIDVDGVLADMHSKMLDIYNEENNSNVVLSDLTRWELPPAFTEIYKRKGFFTDLKLELGARDFLKELDEFCHIIIATSPSHTPHIAMDKMIWMHNVLPEFEDRLCITHNKNIFGADFLLDDYDQHAIMFDGHSPLLMNKPWNENVELPKKVQRVYSLYNALQYIRGFVYSIVDYNHTGRIS